MRTPSPIWTTEYRHDRRKHRHRCRCCNVILQAGESVVMARVAGKASLAVHAACADRPHGTSDATWRDALAAWGTDYLRACGYRMAA